MSVTAHDLKHLLHNAWHSNSFPSAFSISAGLLMSWKKTPILLLRSSKSIYSGITSAKSVTLRPWSSCSPSSFILMVVCSVYRRIKTLRMKIAEVRSQREETEKQLKKKKFTSSKVQKNIEKVQAEMKVNCSKYL